MSEEEIVEELIKWFENYGVMIPDGSSATIKDFMYYSEIQSMAEELYEDFFTDLQSQLAEHNEYFRSFSCENFNEFQDFISTFMLTPHEEQTLIRELKQQLAEKDKEIEELKLDNKKYFTDSCRANKEIAYKLKQRNQKAIEQLEKVKNIILNERKITSFKFDTFNKGKDTALFWLNEQINQQINELKGDK